MPISKIKTSSITADAASTNLNIDANTLFLDAANNRVGIGTNNPSANLDITNTGNATLRLTAGNTSSSIIQLGDTDDGNVGEITYSHSTNSMAFDTNDVERMRIDSSGNVGIGTTTQPSESQTRQTLATSSSTYLQFARTATTVGGSLIGTSGQNFIVQTYTGAIGSETYTERMRIDSSGNVGIGTSSPSNLFHLRGDGNATQHIRIANSQTSYATDLALFTHASGNFSIGLTNSATPLTSQTMTFLVNNSSSGQITAMRIDSSGNVGIGTTSPSTGKFSDASYAFLIQSASTSTGTNIFASNSDNSKYIGLWSGHSGADPAIGVKTGNAFTFGKWAAINGTGGFTENMRLDSSGNLLLGTTASTGLASNSSRIVGGIYNTANGAGVTCLNGTATTIFTLTNYQSSQTWIVSADLAGQSNTDAYSCVYLLVVNYSGATSVTQLRKGSLSSISVSGLDVKYTQSSGGTQTSVCWGAIRIM